MLSLLLGLCLIIPVIQCEEYTNKYDGVDLEDILASERLLTGYVNCLLDLGPCTPDAKELKKNLPDAIENDCKKCNQRQREGADQVMQYIIDHRPDDWTRLELKYNEDGSYKMKYLASKQTKEQHDTTTENNHEENATESDEKED